MSHSRPRVAPGFRAASALGLLLPPVLFGFFSVAFRHHAHSVAVMWDASYYYLFAAFEVATGHWARYIAHPGGTLHLWGGAIVRLRGSLPGSGPISPSELLLHHGLYIEALGTSLIAANVALIALSGFVLSRRGLSLPAIWLTQLLWILTPGTIFFFGLFESESAYWGIAALLAMVLVAPESRRWIAMPILAGSAMALKLNFAGLTAGLWIAKSWRRRLLSVGLFALTFLICCAPLLPQWISALPYFFRMALSSGPYDSGPVGLPAWSRLSHSFDSAGFLLVLPAFAILLGAARLRERDEGRPYRRPFIAAQLIFFAGLFLYLRKPTHPHYLLPALGTFPSVIVLYLLDARGSRSRWLGYAVLVVVALLYLSRIRGAMSGQRELLDRNATAYEDAWAFRERNKGCDTLLGQYVPVELEALNEGARGGWQEDLAAAYPGVGFVTKDGHVQVWNRPWQETEETWLGHSASACWLLLSNPADGQLRREFRVAREGEALGCTSFVCANRLERVAPGARGRRLSPPGKHRL